MYEIPNSNNLLPVRLFETEPFIYYVSTYRGGGGLENGKFRLFSEIWQKIYSLYVIVKTTYGMFEIRRTTNNLSI
jgi:hypothetical protein